MYSRIFRGRMLAIVWTFLMLYLLLRPGSAQTPWWYFFPHIDKLLHMAVFGIWTFLVTQSIAKLRSNVLSIIMTIGILIGVGTEWLQQYIPYRSGNWIDFIADLTGIIIGMFLTFYMKKKQYRTN